MKNYSTGTHNPFTESENRTIKILTKKTTISSIHIQLVTLPLLIQYNVICVVRFYE